MIKPEEFSERLKAALPAGVRSVILYGSSVTGDFIDKRSDYNILVVTDSLGANDLRAMSNVASAWVKAGNPLPLCFTMDRLKSSADVFPLEMLDMKENNRVLLGSDVLADIEVSRVNLRHQLEYELKSKLIRLREGYLLIGNKPKQLVELMTNSVSGFLTLFRGALRLFEKPVPDSKLDAMRALGIELRFPPEPFEMIHELKYGRMAAKKVNADELFWRYLKNIEAVVDAVDKHPTQ